MADFSYTIAERTVKKYTVGQAVKAAEDVLKAKHRLSKLCVNAVQSRSYTELLTLKELSELTEELVDETLSHEGF